MNPIRYLQDNFRHGWKLGLYRMRLQFKRKVWNKKLRPVCWVIGHKPIDWSSWGYTATRCIRCHTTLTYHRHGTSS